VQVTVLTFALAAFLAATPGCGGGNGAGDKTYEGDGYSFTYPGEWDEGETGEGSAQAGQAISSVAFAPGEGADLLNVEVYRVGVSVTEANIDQLSGELAHQVDELLQQADGRLTGGPIRVTLGGLPGFRFDGSLVSVDGVRVQSRLIFVFDGGTEYFLNCQFTPESAAEMKRGCDQVVKSFQVQ
jgi:hypothetical protein